jgi:hypothetical protein
VRSFESERVFTLLTAAVLLLAALLFVGACSGKDNDHKQNNPPKGKTTEETTSPYTTGMETTESSRPPEVTLGKGNGGEPDVIIRLEGDPRTTFSGLCSVGAEQSVLSGQVPKRFEFDLKGRQLSCRIEKRDGNSGELKVVLVAGETTRSVQQTSTPGGAIKVSYKGK